MPSDAVAALRVNGAEVRRLVACSRTLLELLRDELGLHGTKHGCDIGDCGACTVLVDGVPRLSCITLALECNGSEVTTIEGIGTPAHPHPVQRAFHEHVAAQCGYCTPGFVVNLVALLAEDPSPSDDVLRHALGANICRCTGYAKIIDAARAAAGRPP
jgi:aerobic-type carbon monoxide dehydrogenase small subunit (CoxS/CutS family)